MLSRWIPVIFVAVLLCSGVSAQKCPMTERTVFLLVQNGTEARNVRYELYPIRPKSVGNDIDQYLHFVWKKLNYGGHEASDIINARRSRMLLPELAEQLLKRYDPNDYQPINPVVKNDLKGSIQNGKLVFNASEISQNLFILKVTSDNFDTVYYVGDFFGGCSVVDRVTLMKYRPWPEY